LGLSKSGGWHWAHRPGVNAGELSMLPREAKYAAQGGSMKGAK